VGFEVSNNTLVAPNKFVGLSYVIRTILALPHQITRGVLPTVLGCIISRLWVWMWHILEILAGTRFEV
jgi:hypothetical protein